MPVDAPTRKVINAYRKQTLALRNRVLRYIEATWLGMDNYRDRDVDRFVAAVRPVVTGGKYRIATLTDAYLAQVETATFGKRVAPLGVTPSSVSSEALRGVDDATVYRRGGVTVWTALSEGETLTAAVGLGLNRVLDLAATDLQLAKTHTSRSILGRKRGVTGYRRVLEGSKSCGLCIVASTQRYHTGDLLPIHGHCVIGETLVSSDSPREVSRRRYQGEVVVIRTASGNELTITPNHPVLTSSGWVLAGLLREGMDVVSRTGDERVVDGVPNEHDVPTRIQDRFRAGRMGRLVSVPFAAENFHGDVGHGEVDVVPAYRHLGHGLFAPVDQQGFQQHLSLGPDPRLALAGLCPEHQSVLSPGPTPDGIMRGSHLSGPLRGSHAPSAVLASGASTSDLRSVQQQVTTDRSAADSEGFLQAQLALTGLVSVDRVTELRRVYGSHQVFNLHTDSGWYLANRIVVHNCDCSVMPIWGEDPGQVIDIDTLDGVHEAIEERFGASSGDARATNGVPDYRDVLITHHHGELGPVLSVRGQHFTGPSSL